MFINLRVGTKGEEVRYALDVVGVPVRQEDCGDGTFFAGEEGRERGTPGGKALRGVDEDPSRTDADEVGVCS